MLRRTLVITALSTLAAIGCALTRDDAAKEAHAMSTDHLDIQVSVRPPN